MLLPADLAEAIALPPEKAIEWFRQKGYTISWDWFETLQEAHARAFTVARVTRLDTLQTIRGALDKALAEGKTERWFQKTLTPVLQEAGWWGKEEVEVQPGQTRVVQLGSHQRLQLIFRQNMQSAYMAGRWAEIVRNADHRPYLQYIAVMDSKTRPSHAAMHRRVFRWDDPIWQWLWPPNGWGCRCRVRALSEAALKRLGLKVESSDGKLRQKTMTAGVDYTTGEMIRIEVRGIQLTGLDGKPITFWTDPGFSYNPGKAGWEPELDKYSPDIAQKYLEGMRTGPGALA